MASNELLVSVDVETDGPIPSDYSMISIGACTLDLNLEFYSEIKPISKSFVPEALQVSGLDREYLVKHGKDPYEVMRNLAEWLKDITEPINARPVFVGWNAPFDWMFVNWYFHKFYGANPFGWCGWDGKAYYAGLTKNTVWSSVNKKSVKKKGFLSDEFPHTHNALEDAKEQAVLFSRLLSYAGSNISCYQ